MNGWKPCSSCCKKEFHILSNEIRTAAAARSTERPGGESEDMSWASDAIGGSFNTLRPDPIDEIDECKPSG